MTTDITKSLIDEALGSKVEESTTPKEAVEPINVGTPDHYKELGIDGLLKDALSGEPEDSKPSLLESTFAGVRESLDPFGATSVGLSKKEIQEDRGAAGTAARIAGNIITDIGTTLGTGAALGAVAGPVGAVVGAVGLALYRGLGNEAIMSRMSDRDFDLVNGAMSVALELNPLVKYGSKGIVRAVGQAVGQAGLTTRQTGDLTTGLVSGVTAGAFTKLGSKHAPLEVKKAANGELKLQLGSILTTPTKSNPGGKMSLSDVELMDDLVKDKNLGMAFFKEVKKQDEDFFVLKKDLKSYLFDKDTLQKEAKEIQQVKQRFAANKRAQIDSTKREFGRKGDMNPKELMQDIKNQEVKLRKRIQLDNESDRADMIRRGNDTIANELQFLRRNNPGKTWEQLSGKKIRIEQKVRAKQRDWYTKQVNKRRAELKEFTRNKKVQGAEYKKEFAQIKKGKLKHIDSKKMEEPKLSPQTAALKAEAADFSAYLLQQPGIKITKQVQRKVREKLSSVSEEEMASIYRVYKENTLIPKVIKSNPDLVSSTVDALSGNKLGNFLRNGRHTAIAIDEATGMTNMDGTLRLLHYKTNAADVKIAEFHNAAKKIRKMGTKGKADIRAIGRALNSGEWNKLTKTERVMAREYKSLFEKVRQHLNKQGANIVKIDNYLPQKSQNVAEVHRILTKLTKQFTSEDAGFLTKAGFTSKNEHLKDYIKVMSQLNGGKMPTSLKQTHNLIDGVLKTESKNKLGFEAFAAFKRKGKVVDFLREYDVGTAMEKYINTNVKAVYMRDAFEALDTQMAMLRGLGLEDSYKHVHKLYKDLSGSKVGIRASIEHSFNKLKATGNQLIDEDRKILGNSAKFAGDFMKWTMAQAYPNLLGWNLTAPIRNSTQLLMLTAPEIGGAYGYKVVAKGYAKSLSALKKHKGINKFLQQKRLVGGDFIGEGDSLAADSLRNLPLVGKGIEAIEFAGKTGMYLYKKSDEANRFITYHTGLAIAEDIAKGSSKAAKFVKSLPPSVRREIVQGGPENMGDVIGKYLVAKTQFQYSKEALSDFGRTMGPLFSMFTKWPSVIGSDIEHLIKTKGIKSVGAKYLPGLLLVTAGHQILSESDALETPLGKVTLGNGILNYTPLSVFWGLSTPPVIQAGFDTVGVLGDIQRGELDRAGTSLRKTLAPFTPGLGQLNRIYKTGKQATGE